MSAERQLIERNELGHWLKGQSGNPKGAPVGRRRFGKAVERKLEDVQCIETMADNFVEGLKDPDAKPVIGRIAWERFIPVASRHELTGPGGGPIEIASPDEWSRFADLFAQEIPEGEKLALEGDAEGGDREGDERLGLAGET